MFCDTNPFKNRVSQGKSGMPEQKENAHFESGRATAPPSVCHSSLLKSPSEVHTHSNTATSTNLSEQSSGAVSQSSLYSPNFNIFHQKTHSSLSSPSSNSDNSPCPNPHLYYSSGVSKTNVGNLPFQSSQYSADYSKSSHSHSSSFSSSSNCSSYTSSNNNNNNNNNIRNISNYSNSVSINNSNNNNLEFTASKASPKNPEDFHVPSEIFGFQSSESFSAASFNYPNISKPNLVYNLKHSANYSNSLFLPNTQPKCSPTKDFIDLCLEKTTNLKKNFEGNNQCSKAFKDENFEEVQQSFAKNGTKSKNTQETDQDFVTDSFFHLLHKKNSQDNLSYDLSDLSPILVSLTSKYKSEEASGLKKKDNNEDFKLMNDFLTKIILEKEEKRFKSFDKEKKVLHRENFDDLKNEIDERKIKRDAMSHYQEDKNHHKRSSNYGDYNQWEYFNQQDIQSSNNHNRRGHFSFGGTSQQHSVGWNPMGIGMPRQANPYYTNPHSNMMPAHAHSEYRYNQWNSPNHKNIPNVHNAHSQNAVLSQTKMDIKHPGDISNSAQDFGLPISSTSDFSKFRSPSRDVMHCATSSLTDKTTRTGTHLDHLSPMPAAMRNSSSMRVPPIASHPKTVINNPLSDLQMLVSNQENENLPQKADNFQQESVDLSAHSETSKQKENLEDKSLNNNSKGVRDFRLPVSVIQVQNKQVKSDFNESEKPVELTSKCFGKNAKTDNSPQARNDLENENESCENIENGKETVEDKVVKNCEERVKTSVIVEKDGESSASDTKNEIDIPENVEQKAGKSVTEKTQFNEHENKDKEKNVDGNCEMTEQAQVTNNEEARNCTETNENKHEFSDVSKANCNDNTESSRNCKRKAENEEVSGGNKKIFQEVECEPEKNSVVVEKENLEMPKVTSTSAETKPPVNETLKKISKKKPSRKSRVGRLSSGQSSGSERSLHGKKTRSLGMKEDNKKKIKKNLCDVMDRRGPFLHVEGPKESPASVIVINFPKGDDEDEKEKNLVKKQTLSASRTKHHNELDYRGRSRNGLYSSTLSARYDAHTTDHTWVCVFCKKGPHFKTMGDLFGPYIISKDESICLGDFSGDEKDISDAQKRGGRNKKSLRSNNMVEHFQKMSRKLRRVQSTESCLTGMTVIPNDQIDQLRYEVWVHEQCAVWSPNVFLIGSRIIGMQEAIWCSVKTMCSKCGNSGANIGCVYRNCPNRSHYPCAKESGWSLQQETFISTCHIHKPRS